MRGSVNYFRVLEPDLKGDQGVREVSPFRIFDIRILLYIVFILI